MKDVSFRSLFKIVAAAAMCWLVWQLWFVLVLVAIALVIAGTLNPIVKWLEEHKVPRGLALVLVFVGMLGAISLIGLLTVPALVSQLVSIAEKAPALQARLADDMQHSRLFRPLSASVRSFRAAEYMGAAGERILDWSQQLLIFVGEAITTIFLALYLIASREREQAGLFALVPRHYHLRLARILANLEEIVGGYVRGQLITSVLIAVVTFGVLTIFGVPNAVAIAVFAAVTDVLPFIGGLLATTPAVLATLTVGVPAAIAVLAIFILYQEFESRILVPRVYGRVLRLSPATVIVALLAGATLLGIVGALLALPAAAALRMIVKELRVELPGEKEPSTTLRMREAAAEREYEQRAAGAPSGEAAKIAKEMAEEQMNAPPSSSSKPAP